MKARLLFAVVLTPLCLAAEIKLFVVANGVEQVPGESYFVGTVPAGDSVDTTFRIRNAAESSVLLTGLNVAGEGFSPADLPRLPLDLAAGGSLDFVARFRPKTPGSYSAYLNINGIRMTVLLGTAEATLVLSLLREGGKSPLTAGDTVDFGSAPSGGKAVRRFDLSNETAGTLLIERLEVAGAAFRGPRGLAAPITLESKQTANFEVTFEPKSAGVETGTLELNGRSFVLRGTAIEPEFPRPQIRIEPQTLRGGQQTKVTVKLDPAPRYDGEGELSLEFRPSAGAKPDPAVLFPATGGPTVKFRVVAGRDAAFFGDRAETELQTGTTAGTIVITAKLGKNTEEMSAEIPPAAVVVDSTKVLRSATGLEVRVAGFDTSRTASRVTFTFYDRDWNVIAPGAIGADVAAAFRQYFESAAAGGMFLLRAVFPVNGDALKIIAVEVEMTNAVGSTKTARVGIP